MPRRSNGGVLLPAWGDARWRLSTTTPYGQALLQALWADEPCSLESVLITASDDAEVVGLEALPGSQLAGNECLRFRDNRGEELTAWRWRWLAAQEPSCGDGNELQCVGYMIKPAG